MEASLEASLVVTSMGKSFGWLRTMFPLRKSRLNSSSERRFAALLPSKEKARTRMPAMTAIRIHMPQLLWGPGAFGEGGVPLLF